MRIKRILLVLVACIGILTITGCAATPQPGQIGVVREGKSLPPWTWFHGHKIKKIVKPGSGFTYTGLGSSTHWYPTDTVQRNYTITSEANQGDRKGVDVVEVPTQDGVRAGLTGTFYFTTNFNGTKSGEKLLTEFDERFGVRTFRVNNEGDELHPFEGEGGWRAFLSQVVRPVIDNDLRRSIATVTCAQLVSSCALVHNQGNVQAVANQNNNANIAKVQEDINKTLKTDVEQTLGADYFSHISFLLAKVSLPEEIQHEIDKAQGQFAAVGSAQAKVKQAEQDSKANSIRQQGYKNCPACAQIDELKAIPSSVTTFAPGSGFAITSK